MGKILIISFVLITAVLAGILMARERELGDYIVRKDIVVYGDERMIVWYNRDDDDFDTIYGMITLRAPYSLAVDYNLIWPDNVDTGVLLNDGAGNLSWSNVDVSDYTNLTVVDLLTLSGDTIDANTAAVANGDTKHLCTGDQISDFVIALGYLDTETDPVFEAADSNDISHEIRDQWDGAYTHITSTGTDHSYIDQDVTTSSTPNFASVNLSGDHINIATTKTPSSGSDTGTAGDVGWDSDYLYVCIITDTWKRVKLTSWPSPSENVTYAGEDVIYAGEDIVFP